MRLPQLNDNPAPSVSAHYDQRTEPALRSDWLSQAWIALVTYSSARLRWLPVSLSTGQPTQPRQAFRFGNEPMSDYRYRQPEPAVGPPTGAQAD